MLAKIKVWIGGVGDRDSFCVFVIKVESVLAVDSLYVWCAHVKMYVSVCQRERVVCVCVCVMLKLCITWPLYLGESRWNTSSMFDF